VVSQGALSRVDRRRIDPLSRRVARSQRGLSAGIRLASDERILGSGAFVKATLKHVGKLYDHRMRIQSAGIDLSAVIAVAGRYFNIKEKEPDWPTRRVEIACARAA
jgi:hypothetical protein